MESPPSPTCSSLLPSASQFAHLPIMAMKEKIVDKIMENRVTLIVGETGCGIISTLFSSSEFSIYTLLMTVYFYICISECRRFK